MKLYVGNLNFRTTEDELRELLGCDKKRPLMEAPRYLGYKERRLFVPVRRRPYIAVVSVKG
ncbi:MAG: hypothetical protein AAFX76_05770, partial [Planctomycetota bacterium]